MSSNGAKVVKKGDKITYQGVKVYLRTRPFNKQEIDTANQNIIKYTTKKEIVLKGPVNKKFLFDEIFSEKVNQEYVYSIVVEPLIESVLNGYNCTAFAYGQTGTGKTHTMTGADLSSDVNFANDANAGLIPRSAMSIFDHLKQLDLKTEYTVRVSFIEIYNEELRDLLGNEEQHLKIYDDAKNKGSVFINNLNEITVCNVNEVYDLLKRGNEKRQTAATNLNRQSSRSHTVFTITVHTRRVVTADEETIKMGKLYLVDLAGSENVGRSGATDARLREAGTINKSLLTLGKIITSLVHKTGHVPYRESKLTRILQDSLGGKTKTCMIATISPSFVALDETLSTLEYASLARNIKNCPQANEQISNSQMMTDLSNEIERLRRDLIASRQGEGFYICQENYEKMCQEIEQSQKEIEENKEDIAVKNKKIDELEVYKKMKENDYINLTKSFEITKTQLQKTNEEYQKQSEILEEERCISEYFQNREKELRNTANKLLAAAEKSTANENILHEKINNLYELSTKNLNTLRNMFSIFHNNLQDIQDKLNNFTDLQEDKFSNVQKAIESINQIKEDISEKISENSNQIIKNINELTEKDEDYSEKIVAEIFDINKFINMNEHASKISLCSLEEDENKKQMTGFNSAIIDSIVKWENKDDTFLNKFIMIEDEVKNTLKSVIMETKKQKDESEEMDQLLQKCLRINNNKLNRCSKQLNDLETFDLEISNKMASAREEFVSNKSNIRQIVEESKDKTLDMINTLSNTIKSNKQSADDCKNEFIKFKTEGEIALKNVLDDETCKIKEYSTRINTIVIQSEEIKMSFDLCIQKYSDKLHAIIQECKDDLETHNSKIKNLTSETTEIAIIHKQNIIPVSRKGDTPNRPKQIKKDFIKDILCKRFKKKIDDNLDNECGGSTNFEVSYSDILINEIDEDLVNNSTTEENEASNNS